MSIEVLASQCPEASIYEAESHALEVCRVHVRHRTVVNSALSASTVDINFDYYSLEQYDVQNSSNLQ